MRNPARKQTARSYRRRISDSGTVAFAALASNIPSVLPVNNPIALHHHVGILSRKLEPHEVGE